MKGVALLQRVLVRGLSEGRDHGKRKGWVRRGHAEDVVAEIDVRLRAATH